MGVFYSFCGGQGRKNNISNSDKAVLDLKVQRDKLKQYQIQINLVIQKEIEIAKECTKTNKKSQALLALKKKKYQEKLLDDTNQNLLNIQEMISKIELAEFQIKIFDSLKKGNTALNALQKEMSLEDVDNLMAETEEAIAYQNEISNALAGQFSPEEEDSLMNELEEMEKQMTNNQYPKVPNTKLDINLDHIIPVKLPFLAVEQQTKQAVQLGGDGGNSNASGKDSNTKAEQLVPIEDEVEEEEDIEVEEEEEEDVIVEETKPKKQLEMAM